MSKYDRDIQDVYAVKQLGDTIGYGHLMAIAHELWARHLESKGLPRSGAHCVVGYPMIKEEYQTEALNDPIYTIVVDKGLADRKDENSSEIPNNCEYAENPSGDVWECGCFLDTYCEHQIYDRNPDGTINIVECGYEPKTEPTGDKLSPVEGEQTETKTETQNSNLTFKTLEYCDICDHKGCEECIANALDEHCIPSQFKKQIEDECAKEYEELGLKELKELIKADRKTEPTISKMEQVDEPKTQTETQNSNLTFEKRTMRDCYNCKRYETEGECIECHYEPKDEPQMGDAKPIPLSNRVTHIKDEPQTEIKGSKRLLKGSDEPQTDCPWK